MMKRFSTAFVSSPSSSAQLVMMLVQAMFVWMHLETMVGAAVGLQLRMNNAAVGGSAAAPLTAPSGSAGGQHDRTVGENELLLVSLGNNILARVQLTRVERLRGSITAKRLETALAEGGAVPNEVAAAFEVHPPKFLITPDSDETPANQTQIYSRDAPGNSSMSLRNYRQVREGRMVTVVIQTPTEEELQQEIRNMQAAVDRERPRAGEFLEPGSVSAGSVRCCAGSVSAVISARCCCAASVHLLGLCDLIGGVVGVAAGGVAGVAAVGQCYRGTLDCWAGCCARRQQGGLLRRREQLQALLRFRQEGQPPRQQQMMEQPRQPQQLMPRPEVPPPQPVIRRGGWRQQLEEPLPLP
ncbi:unnamed protein product [Amoebophrya sp. A120]|nr:unnamed protein product [Amoebophrya sp. A120]|eukprot:GSA120T00007518001.1